MRYHRCTPGRRSFCHVGDKTSECKPGLFKTPILRETCQVQRQHLVECSVYSVIILLNHFHGHVKKQTVVSHCSPEAEVRSLDTGLRMEGLPALMFCDIVIDTSELPASRARGDPSRQLKFKTSQATQESIDDVLPNAQESSNRAHFLSLRTMKVR